MIDRSQGDHSKEEQGQWQTTCFLAAQHARVMATLVQTAGISGANAQGTTNIQSGVVEIR
jgi:hypothetical protein